MRTASSKDSSQSRRDETKLRILEATLNLMVKYGYKGTTTRKIAEEAGVNEVTVFRHFKNKKSILRGIIKNAKYLSRSHMFDDFVHGEFESVEELFEKYSEMAFESFLINRDLFLLFLKESGNEESEFYKLHYESMFNLISEFNKKMLNINKKEKIKKSDLMNASYIYHAATLASTYWYVLNEKKISKSDMKLFIKNVTRIIMHGIKQ